MLSSQPVHRPKTPVGQHKYIVSGDRAVFHAKHYMSDPERRTLISELNISALVLYEHYLRLACRKDSPEITDDSAVIALGMNKHTIGGLRRSLINAGWVKIVKLPRHPVSGHSAHLYYLGKEAVKGQSKGILSMHY